MSEVRISAEPRTEFGKGGARRTRRAGKVPAVLYGHGEKPKHIALPAREFAAAIRHGDHPGLIDERGPLTFAELDARTNALACALRARGVIEGDSVGILCRNHRGFQKP